MNTQDIELKDEERTECEVWTRVMGYLRPVSEYNIGKKSEYCTRTPFVEKNVSASSAEVAAE
jgi:hypothetical protein